MFSKGEERGLRPQIKCECGHPKCFHLQKQIREIRYRGECEEWDCPCERFQEIVMIVP